MEYDKIIAQALAKTLTFSTRIRTEKIRKAHKGNRGADLCFVDVAVAIGGSDTQVPTLTLPFVAKVTQGAGRWLSIPTTMGTDNRRRPNFILTNEFRAVLYAAVFAHPRVKVLAEAAERHIKANAEPLEFRPTGGTPAAGAGVQVGRPGRRRLAAG